MFFFFFSFSLIREFFAHMLAAHGLPLSDLKGPIKYFCHEQVSQLRLLYNGESKKKSSRVYRVQILMKKFEYLFYDTFNWIYVVFKSLDRFEDIKSRKINEK